MSTFAYLLSPLMLLLIYILLRSYWCRKKNLPGILFAEALRNENNGEYEQALVNYNNALQQAGKTWFRNADLKSRIIEKCKVLKTAIAYKRSFLPV